MMGVNKLVLCQREICRLIELALKHDVVQSTQAFSVSCVQLADSGSRRDDGQEFEVVLVDDTKKPDAPATPF